MKGEAREEGGGRAAHRSASKARQASAQVVKPDVRGRRSRKESHGLNRSKSSMASTVWVFGKSRNAWPEKLWDSPWGLGQDLLA